MDQVKSSNRLYNRIFLIVMDSVGIGELPDAAQYGDTGAHTLDHIEEHRNGLDLKQLRTLGLGNIAAVNSVAACTEPMALYGRMQEASIGKDTLTGHWEIMGLKVEKAFRTFTDHGFPSALIEQFEQRIGRRTIGNKSASGTEIIEEYGKEHMETGSIIVYTSTDSVFQIAAHEEIVPLQELYRICEIARELTLEEPYLLGRVIARPFVGGPGSFQRTANRHDYAVKPFSPTVMNGLVDAGFDSIALGKISDIYAEEGVTSKQRTVSNMDGMDKLVATMRESFTGLCFLNLVDFDSLFGHRRDPDGYGRALEEFDARLPEVLALLKDDDLLIITADHGNDPTHAGTDHTREYVPLLAYSPTMRGGIDIGTRETFADIGATIADNFGSVMPQFGTSFLNQLRDVYN